MRNPFRRKTGKAKGGTKTSNGAIGLFFVVLIVVALYLSFAKAIPFVGNPYELKVALTNANGIKKSSPVRIAGVDVGKVSQVKPVGRSSPAAIVTVTITDAGRPIHKDAQIKVRPRLFLEGNFFLNMTQGTASEPVLASGDTIPASQTQLPVQFFQVLGALTSDTRADARAALASLFQAYSAGFGTQFNKGLSPSVPAFRYSSIVNDALQGIRPNDLSNALYDQGRISQAIDQNPAALDALLANLNTTAGALADTQADLQRDIRELPATLRASKPAFAALNAAFPAVRRLAREAIPGVRSTGPTVDATLPLITQLRGLVQPDELQGLSRDLRDTIPALAQVTRQSVPLLRDQVRPLAACQNQLIVPWSRLTLPDPNFPSTGPLFQDLPKFLPNLAGESRSNDANGQWFKVLGAGGTETLDLGNGLFAPGATPGVGVNPPKSAPPALNNDNVACETQQVPDLRTAGSQPAKTAKIDLSSKLVKTREALARAVAILTTAGGLQQQGLDKQFKVVPDDATMSVLRKVAARNGLTKNMDDLLKATRERTTVSKLRDKGN